MARVILIRIPYHGSEYIRGMDEWNQLSMDILDPWPGVTDI